MLEEEEEEKKRGGRGGGIESQIREMEKSYKSKYVETRGTCPSKL